MYKAGLLCHVLKAIYEFLRAHHNSMYIKLTPTFFLLHFSALRGSQASVENEGRKENANK